MPQLKSDPLDPKIAASKGQHYPPQNIASFDTPPSFHANRYQPEVKPHEEPRNTDTLLHDRELPLDPSGSHNVKRGKASGSLLGVSLSCAATRSPG